MAQEPSTPFIFIPYTRADKPDDGFRPLPPASKASYYQCDGILVNGVPYDGTKLNPGTPYELTAKVVNLGGIPCSVTVRFYPSDPATEMDPSKLLPGATPFTAPAAPTKINVSPPVIFTPSFDQPSHICLFAEATTILDRADGSGDAVNNRHYAQQNINILTTTAGQRLTFPFSAVGGRQPAEFMVSVRQVMQEEPGNVPGLMFQPGALLIVDPAQGTAPQDTIRLDLGVRERRALQAVLYVPDDAVPGAKAYIRIEQAREQTGPTGGIDITVAIEI